MAALAEALWDPDHPKKIWTAVYTATDELASGFFRGFTADSAKARMGIADWTGLELRDTGFKDARAPIPDLAPGEIWTHDGTKCVATPGPAELYDEIAASYDAEITKLTAKRDQAMAEADVARAEGRVRK